MGKQPAAVIGVGQTHHRAKREDLSMAGLCREAMDRALADAGMTLAEIDAIVVGKAPDLFEGVMMPELYLAEALGAVGKPLLRVHTAGSVGGSTAIVAACNHSPTSRSRMRSATANGLNTLSLTYEPGRAALNRYLDHVEAVGEEPAVLRAAFDTLDRIAPRRILAGLGGGDDESIAAVITGAGEYRDRFPAAPCELSRREGSAPFYAQRKFSEYRNHSGRSS